MDRRRVAMEQFRSTILRGGADHPLNFLLDCNGKWRARFVRKSGAVGLSEDERKENLYAVHAGHEISEHSGLSDRIMLEDAVYNSPLWGAGPELSGQTIFRPGILIGGVPVELETARHWKNDLHHLQGIDLHDRSRRTIGK